jgi:hypothetical protein
MPVGKATSSSGEEIDFTLADLNEIADSYDGVNNPAPIVIGHPKSNEPAMGWFESIKVVGNQLMGIPTKVNEAFKESVKRGEYLKVSPSIFKRDANANPTKGKLSLRHLGALGAGAPAMPNGVLNPDDFADTDESFCFDFSFEEVAKQKKLETKPKRKKTVSKDKEKEANDFAELQRRLDASELKNKELAKTNSDLIKNSIVKETDDFCAELVKAGNILPSHKDSVKAIFGSLDSLDSSDFSEGDNPRELVKGFLKTINAFDFNEKSKDNDEPKPHSDFNAPTDAIVVKDDLVDLAEIEAFAKKEGISLEDAMIKRGR